LAFDGRVKRLRKRVVDYADCWNEVYRETERDGYVGVAVYKVGCAVDGVENDLNEWSVLRVNNAI
jgi:hypothetical protein